MTPYEQEALALLRSIDRATYWLVMAAWCAFSYAVVRAFVRWCLGGEHGR